MGYQLASVTITVNYSNIKTKMVRVKICEVSWETFSLKILILTKVKIIHVFREIIDIMTSDTLHLLALPIQSNMLSQCTD